MLKTRWWLFLACAALAASSACTDPGARAPRAVSEPLPQPGPPTHNAAAKAPEGSSQAVKTTGSVAKASEPSVRATPRDGMLDLPITPDNSRIEWTAAKLTVQEKGRFTRFSGVVRLDPESLERSEVEVRIDTASVYAEPERLAKHLRDVDFLGVEHFPQASFRSLSLRPSPQQDATHLVTGELTLHGQTRQLTFPARIELGAHLTAHANFSINRMDFGIAENRSDRFIRELVVIEFALDLPR